MIHCSNVDGLERAQKIKKDLVKNLLLMSDMTHSQIAKIAELTEEEVELIARRIKKQMGIVHIKSPVRTFEPGF